MQIISDERTGQQKNDTPQPLGRILVPEGQYYEEQATKPARSMPVPVEQDYEEEQKPKKRRRQADTGRKRRRLIVHIVILVVLLAIIIFGLSYFFGEGKQEEIPQPNKEETLNIVSHDGLMLA